MTIAKMEPHYQTKTHTPEEYLQNLHRHLPELAKELFDLYISPLKYKVKYEMAKSEHYDSTKLNNDA